MAISSWLEPVSRFTTPPGNSLSTHILANEDAQSALVCDTNTTQVLPPTMAGAITETRPTRPLSSGAMIETTPVGSEVKS